MTDAAKQKAARARARRAAHKKVEAARRKATGARTVARVRRFQRRMSEAKLRRADREAAKAEAEREKKKAARKAKRDRKKKRDKAERERLAALERGLDDDPSTVSADTIGAPAVTPFGAGQIEAVSQARGVGMFKGDSIDAAQGAGELAADFAASALAVLRTWRPDGTEPTWPAKEPTWPDVMTKSNHDVNSPTQPVEWNAWNGAHPTSIDVEVWQYRNAEGDPSRTRASEWDEAYATFDIAMGGALSGGISGGSILAAVNSVEYVPFGRGERNFDRAIWKAGRLKNRGAVTDQAALLDGQVSELTLAILSLGFDINNGVEVEEIRHPAHAGDEWWRRYQLNEGSFNEWLLALQVSLDRIAAAVTAIQGEGDTPGLAYLLGASVAANFKLFAAGSQTAGRGGSGSERSFGE